MTVVDTRTGEISEPLGEEERNELAAHEQIIKQGLRSFVEVGNALVAIRDAGLYRESHGSFEAYCRDRWSMGKSRAYRLIEASSITQALSPMGDTVPTTERQARELTGLPPATAAQVMERAASNGAPTAASIRRAREAIAPKPSPTYEPSGMDEFAPRPAGWMGPDDWQSTDEIQAAGDPAEDVVDAEIVEDEPPAPIPITGRDGKTYQRPAPTAAKAAPRKALTDQAKDAGWEIRKSMERVERVIADDRFTQNREQVTTALRGHLLYVAEAVAAALDRIDPTHKERNP